MNDGVETLKSHARRLQRLTGAGDPEAFRRLRTVDELRRLDDAGLAGAVKRRHCLAVLARELGFEGWPHASRVLRGAEAADFGRLLCPPRCGAHWNIWFASYDQAEPVRAETGGFLLAYRRQFLVVDEHYVRTLGLDPDDPDWEALGRDWVRPRDPAARARLYGKLVQATLGVQGAGP